MIFTEKWKKLDHTLIKSICDLPKIVSSFFLILLTDYFIDITTCVVAASKSNVYCPEVDDTNDTLFAPVKLINRVL